ncbi:hypothetical protein PZA11_000440 [Diplocarpon coronariae]
MSTAEINHLRNGTPTGGSGLSARQREAAESKLFYMKDVCCPDDFQALVDEELRRAAYTPTVSSFEQTIRKMLGKLKLRWRSSVCHA